MNATPQTPGRLTSQQTEFLLQGISGKRVQHLRGMSHLEAWDVRRTLIRIFGFEGFDVETLSLDLVAERETKQGERSRWTVVYRAQVRLVIRDPQGRAVCHFEDAAAGDSVNQPSLGDAHDMAMKTALSQALKRCAVNLGDQFGLSLYNDGDQRPVVLRSLAYMATPPQESEDAPVRPEPTPEPLRAVPTAEPSRDFLAEAHAAGNADEVVRIFREAEAAGAAPELLDELRGIGRAKRAAEQPPQQDDHAAAVAELRAAADAANLEDFDNGAALALGCPIAQATPDAIRALASQISGHAA